MPISGRTGAADSVGNRSYSHNLPILREHPYLGAFVADGYFVLLADAAFDSTIRCRQGSLIGSTSFFEFPVDACELGGEILFRRQVKLVLRGVDVSAFGQREFDHGVVLAVA